jgi:cytochrome P450
MIITLLKARVELEESTKRKPRKDFMHYLMAAVDPATGNKYSENDLISESGVVLTAGTDTTATALAATMFYLTRYPHALHKLQSEVRDAFSNINEIRHGPELTSLVYLRAVIDEALRMASPVPDVLSRRVLPGGAKIDGQQIPAGTFVGMSMYSVHHNEEYYPNSFEFVPERWIVPSTKTTAETTSLPLTGTPDLVERAKSAFFAFSTGTRGCVGKNMAYLELSVCLARLVWALDFKIPDNAELAKIGGGGVHRGTDGEIVKGRHRQNEYQIWNCFVADKEGPYVQFRVREGVDLDAT